MEHSIYILWMLPIHGLPYELTMITIPFPNTRLQAAGRWAHREWIQPILEFVNRLCFISVEVRFIVGNSSLQEHANARLAETHPDEYCKCKDKHPC